MAAEVIGSSHTVKKVTVFLVPAEMSITKLSWLGIIYLFLTRESLVGDIPAGEGENDNLFLQCMALAD
jgi:hypothetical protein